MESVVEGLFKANISQPVLSLFPSPKTSINLSIAQPLIHDNDFTRWASVAEYGAIANDGLERVHCHSVGHRFGKSTVYFPPGIYVQNTVQVRGKVKKVLGMFATLVPDRSYPGNIPAFNVAKHSRLDDFVFFERFVFVKNSWILPILLLHLSLKTHHPSLLPLEI